MKFRSFFILLAAIQMNSSVIGQLIVDESVNEESAIIDILAGGSLSVSDISYSGDNNQIGSFSSASSNVGVEQGVILATGSVLGAIGPNNSSSVTSGGGNLNESDPDLELISGGPMHDAAILEFDFTPTSDTVLFRYVFASEEYDEYVCSDFNDAFGFFLSGPGIEGPYSNSAKNIATIPNSETAVSINTINNGITGAFGYDSICSAIDPDWQMYSTFYVDNSTSTGGNEIQYDGFTTLLTAGSAVQCGETYHLKIAIADAQDDNFDSAIFLEGGSLETSGINMNFVLNDAPGAHPENCLVEGCIGGVLSISRSEADEEATYPLTTTGSADPDSDLSGIPTEVTFAPGIASVQLDVEGETDANAEGEEELTIYLEYADGCGSTTTLSETILIQDYTPLSISVEDELALCPNETVVVEATVIGGLEPYAITWDGEPGTNSFSASEAGDLMFQVSDFCAESELAIISVEVADELQAEMSAEVCQNEEFSVSIISGSAPFTMTWDDPEVAAVSEGIFLIDEEMIASITVEDNCGSTWQGSIESVLCELEDEPDELTIPNVFTPNNDGLNDTFRITGVEGVDKGSLIVTNRWGDTVFSSDSYLNNWDGYGLSDGIYYYTLVTSASQKHSGTVTILRD